METTNLISCAVTCHWWFNQGCASWPELIDSPNIPLLAKDTNKSVVSSQVRGLRGSSMSLQINQSTQVEQHWFRHAYTCAMQINTMHSHPSHACLCLPLSQTRSTFCFLASLRHMSPPAYIQPRTAIAEISKLYKMLGCFFLVFQLTLAVVQPT